MRCIISVCDTSNIYLKIPDINHYKPIKVACETHYIYKPVGLHVLDGIEVAHEREGLDVGLEDGRADDGGRVHAEEAVAREAEVGAAGPHAHPAHLGGEGHVELGGEEAARGDSCLEGDTGSCQGFF